MTDFHSHILPCVDDGSQSVQESIAMLHMEAEQGIAHVIATPHFYPRYDTAVDFLTKRETAMNRLCKEMEQYSGLPKVTMGAEVYFFRGMSESEQLSQLTIEGSHSILIEMPPSPWTEDMYRELEAIWVRRGITPIIAHVDRYIRPFHTHGIPRKLADLPVLVQANAEFFLNKRTAGMALRMLKAGQIHLLGSDCHNLKTRKPNMGEAIHLIQRKLGENMIRQLQDYEIAVWNV